VPKEDDKPKKEEIGLKSYIWGDDIIIGTNNDNPQPKKIGWSNMESDLNWTTKDSVCLIFPVSTMPVTDSIKMICKLSGAFLYKGKIDCQRVIVYANNQRVAAWNIMNVNPSIQEAVIPTQLIKDKKELVISFKLPDAASPADLGIHPDDRKLGIAVSKISFKEL
jgi:hypothetical protein